MTEFASSSLLVDIYALEDEELSDLLNPWLVFCRSR